MAAITHRLGTSGLAVSRSAQPGLRCPSRSLTVRRPALASTLPHQFKRNHQTSPLNPSANNGESAGIYVSNKHIQYSTKAKIATGKQLARSDEFFRLISHFLGGECGGYCEAERNFMLSLTQQDCKKLDVEGKPWWFAAANHRTYLDILATLIGLKPCALHHTAATDPAPVFDRLVTTTLLPMFNELQLEQYGFVFRKVTHDIKLDTHDDLRNAWVLADTRSSEWELVNDIFFTSNVRYHKSSATAKALGYPVFEQLRGPLTTRYMYLDVGATRNLAQITGAQVSPVIGFDYWASDHPEQGEHSRHHFELYQGTLAKYGVELELLIISDSSEFHVESHKTLGIICKQF
jgi:hypothetical protein